MLSPFLSSPRSFGEQGKECIERVLLTYFLKSDAKLPLSDPAIAKTLEPLCEFVYMRSNVVPKALTLTEI